MEVAVLLLMLLVCLVSGVAAVLVYFLPTVVAMRVRHRNALPIFVVNLFFGWTLLGLCRAGGLPR